MRSPELSNRGKSREWSPGFWERMDALAAGIDVEAPERLPSSEHRYTIFDEATSRARRTEPDSPEG